MGLSDDREEILMTRQNEASHARGKVLVVLAFALALIGTWAACLPCKAFAMSAPSVGTYAFDAAAKESGGYSYRVSVQNVDAARGLAQMTVKKDIVYNYTGYYTTSTNTIYLDLRSSGPECSFSFVTGPGSRGTGTLRVLSPNVIQLTLKTSKMARMERMSIDTYTTIVLAKGNSFDGMMCRMYNRNSGEHFFTSNVGERNNLAGNGWPSEGVAWKTPGRSRTPVYRLYNPNAGEHHYTTNSGERDNLIRSGWRDEGVGWYSDDAKRVPVYRVYNPNAYANNHHYTTSKHERDQLLRLGWRNEGIGWYGV